MGTPEAARQFLEVLTKESGYFDSVLRNVRDVRVPASGHLLCTMLVDESMQNRYSGTDCQPTQDFGNFSIDACTSGGCWC